MRSLKSSIGNLQSSMLSLLLAAGMLLAGAARGAEYFVATNGSDGATGEDWGHALLTISAAVAKNRKGQTICQKRDDLMAAGKLLPGHWAVWSGIEDALTGFWPQIMHRGHSSTVQRAGLVEG